LIGAIPRQDYIFPIRKRLGHRLKCFSPHNYGMATGETFKSF